jgi:hypothetical protein
MAVRSEKSQCGIILKYLQAGRTLTEAGILRHAGARAGAQRIANLRDDGWRIGKEMIQVAPRTRVAQYYLDLDYHKENPLLRPR